MTAELAGFGAARVGARRTFAAASDFDILRTVAISAGIGASILFVFLGLRFGLQMYADGSLFSYAVAVQDAWAFHCHNIAGRLTVYFLAFLPAETYVRLTGDPQGGVALYGFLFFLAQGAGLALTFAADRSRNRIIFAYGCASTACLCPMVFGFPTEVWVMHALFWPALAMCHYARRGIAGNVSTFVLLAALAFTHASALIAGWAIVVTLALRDRPNPRFEQIARLGLTVLLLWVIVKANLRPDDYVSAVLMRAALHVFDLSIFTGPFMLLLTGALAGYLAAFAVFRRLDAERAHLFALSLTIAGLAIYWIGFDQALHAANRYYMRTPVLIAVPVLGMVAGAHTLFADGELNPMIPFLPRLLAALTSETAARMALGAIAVVISVHVVETTKFIAAWSRYQSAVAKLAMSDASDPALGDPRFVSSERISPQLNRLSWMSTTHFLSVLLAPSLKPARLVVDPSATYFWLSCETATESRDARRAAPVQARELVRVYSCLHRKRRLQPARR
jgi:hypothetical protein